MSPPPPHQYDPHRRPDDDYEPGRLEHLVPGNRGRLLDPRRTPVRITGIRTDTGAFTVELLAFEDAGASWDIPFERVASYQFEVGCATAAPADVAVFLEAVDRFARPMVFDAPAETRVASERRLDAATAEARAWLERSSEFRASGERLDTRASTGSAALARDLRAFLRERDLDDMDEAFAAQYVRNPYSGELIKGHRIAIAELGLVGYEDSIVRDSTLFDGRWNRSRRADHVVWRLAFVRAALASAGMETVVLYRGMCIDGAIEPPRNETFVSASFDFEIARSCFGETDRHRTGVLLRQSVPLWRLFMTYLETPEMNLHYRESEAVLLHEPGNPIF
jgi:hypothetical protein